MVGEACPLCGFPLDPGTTRHPDCLTPEERDERKGKVGGQVVSYLGQSLGSVEPEVCVTHGRFRPCRKRFLCRYTSDPVAVAAVRDYQNGKLSTWEAALWE